MKTLFKISYQIKKNTYQIKDTIEIFQSEEKTPIKQKTLINFFNQIRKNTYQIKDTIQILQSNKKKHLSNKSQIETNQIKDTCL